MTETADRWRRVEAICQSALDRPASDRLAYVRDACGGDAELAREVQELLAREPDAERFLAESIGAVAAGEVSTGRKLLSGQMFNGLDVVELIGAGGMGEVYRARDTRLGRDVAIKILPRAFTNDPERVKRFEREARMLAALNHPNIAGIYGLEEADGMRALVLEFVDGETLADRVARGPLPLKDALAVARQIVDALDAAHERGIVHRDLKPSNVALTRDGTVKVLDFGLAKASADGSSPDLTHSPTLTDDRTRDGIILGTAGYMSPEQARGQAVDKRTDIWAFGCVLYEMLTGYVAFPGKSVPDILAGVLEREPDWARLPSTTPPAIRRLLARCLEKDAKRRLRDIGDAANELSDATTDPPNVTAPSTPGRRWVWAFASVSVAVGLAFGWAIANLPQPPAVENRTLRLTVNPPAGTEFGVDTGGAISPDGRMLALVTGSSGNRKLWVRALNSLSARELPGTDAATFPFWSPDSRSLAFFAAGKLKRIEAAGGPPTVICDVGSGRGGSWNEEGVILFNSVNDGPLLRVPATGGTPVPLTTVDKARGENSHRWPQFLPGGRRFLFFVRTDRLENWGVYLGSLDRPDQKVLVLNSPTNALYAPDGSKRSGHLLWVRDGTLMAQPFDLDEGQTTGEAVALAEAVGFGDATRLGAVSASSDGALLYGGSPIRQLQLTWFDREGKAVGTVGQPGEISGPRISPDGRRAAFARGGSVSGRSLHSIWQIEFARGISTRVTFSGDVGADPVWSPNGQRIASWGGGAPPNLFSYSANGTGEEERLIESRDSLLTQDWSRDGRFVLYLANSNDLSSKMRSDLWVLPMTGNRQPVPYLPTPFHEGRGQFSPDGKWVAYTSDESGANEVYVQSFPAGGAKWPVSTNGGDWVRWRGDGREIVYVAADRRVMSVGVRAIPGSLELGTPRPLFTIPMMPVAVATSGSLAPYTYDVMPDGQRFLATAPVADAPPPTMTVIVNWQAELSAARK